MKSNSLLIDFIGIEPDYEVKDLVSTAADIIKRNAPSDSFMRLEFKKAKEMIQATCKVVSSIGQFEATSTGNNILMTVEQMKTSLKHQFDHWKKQRFSEWSTKYKSISDPHLEITLYLL